MIKQALNIILYATIEDYTRLEHIKPELYSIFPNECEKNILEIEKKILSFYLDNDIISIFYEKWGDTKFIHQKISKDKAKIIIMDDSSWGPPDINGVYITASATEKGENLYYSGQIMTDEFKIPNNIP